MEWGRLLAYITGTVDQELLLRNEYLAAENRILRGQLKGRLRVLVNLAHLFQRALMKSVLASKARSDRSCATILCELGIFLKMLFGII